MWPYLFNLADAAVDDDLIEDPDTTAYVIFNDERCAVGIRHHVAEEPGNLFGSRFSLPEMYVEWWYQI